MRQVLFLLTGGLLVGFVVGWGLGSSSLGPASSTPSTPSTTTAITASEAPIRAYFSPSDDPERAILSALQNAKNSIHIALYQLTDPEIAQAISESFKRGLELQILLDDEPSRGSKGCLLWSAGIPVKQYVDTGIMHHKFVIIDGAKVITGSYNWTTAAQTRNEENLIAIESTELAQGFEREFQRLWTHKKARFLDQQSCP